MTDLCSLSSIGSVIKEKEMEQALGSFHLWDLGRAQDHFSKTKRARHDPKEQSFRNSWSAAHIKEGYKGPQIRCWRCPGGPWRPGPKAAACGLQDTFSSLLSLFFSKERDKRGMRRKVRHQLRPSRPEPTDLSSNRRFFSSFLFSINKKENTRRNDWWPAGPWRPGRPYLLLHKQEEEGTRTGSPSLLTLTRLCFSFVGVWERRRDWWVVKVTAGRP